MDKVEQKKEHEVKNSSEGTAARFAVLLEWETVALRARKGAFTLLERSLKKAGVEGFQRVTFCRTGQVLLPALLVPAVLRDLKADESLASKLTDEVEQGLQAYYSASGTALAPGIKEFVQRALDGNFAVGIVSLRPTEEVLALAERAGLDSGSLVVFNGAEQAGPDYPDAKTWMLAAKECGCLPRACVAVASSAKGCNGALTAAMRCIAVPDEFTDYQDFGGAEYVVDSLKECNPGDLKALLSPHDE